jgi:tripartite-type tricarboxylate transporter receptor subunit TctC
MKSNQSFNIIFGFYACIFLHALTPQIAFAQYPDRPIKFIVPFSPGGGTDLVARTIGASITEELRQTVIVDNKPGGSTVVGTDALAKSPPDGYSFVIATFAHAVNPSLKEKLPYSQDKDFAPVTLVGVSPNVLVVAASSPYKNIKDLLDAAKSKPGSLSYASQGSGTSAHLAGELFSIQTGSKLIHVPYKGAGPALTDVMGGQVDMMFATASAVGSLIESGKLRPLAVTTTTRSTTPLLASLPTIAESGIPGYFAASWYGVFAPAGTPSVIIQKMNASIKKAVQTKAFKDRVESEGLMISAGSPEDFAKFVKSEEQRWKEVIKNANIKAD